MKSRIKKNSWLQDITPTEYTVGIIKCTVRFLLILYLFYESILPAILLFPLWFLYMKEWMEEKAIGKEQEFRRQFRDSIQTMAGALKAGYSVENAIRETNRDLIGMYDANTRIRKEYGQMVRKLDLNLSVVTVLNEFAAEVKQEDGRPESECYEAFGRRCESPVYRKFGMLLSQNLRKGTKGLTNLLQREAQEAFEERKNMAKKLGEEAGTKLMIPLFLMLAVVFVIVTVPAFLTIQI